MSGLLLSPAESQRFADYCLNEAESYSGLVREMQKAGFPDAVITHHKQLAAAYLIVARHIASAEHVSIGANDQGEKR